MFHGNLLRKSHDPVENDLGNIHKRWRLDSKQISAIASHLFFPPNVQNSTALPYRLKKY